MLSEENSAARPLCAIERNGLYMEPWHFKQPPVISPIELHMDDLEKSAYVLVSMYVNNPQQENAVTVFIKGMCTASKLNHNLIASISHQSLLFAIYLME